MEHDGILIVDFGGQLTQLIARRLREQSIYSSILPGTTALDHIHSDRVKGLILSGGPNSTISDSVMPKLAKLWACQKPILGICYGMQLIASALGGRVERGQSGEFGPARVTMTGKHASGGHDFIGHGITNDSSFTAWMSHRDSVIQVPENFRILATSNGSMIAAFDNEDRKIYGVQFHPEASQTEGGRELLAGFATNVCDCPATWTMGDYRKKQIARLREQIGTDRVVCAISGGVDSSVTALLLQEAIGDRLLCIFVDTGLMRFNESAEVQDAYTGVIDNLRVVNAEHAFFSALRGISDPEEKRKIIGSLFIKTFRDALRNDDDIRYLAQGTLYPDVIESLSSDGTGSVTIKSHHNVGGLPKDMPYQLIEPLRFLFKDEVRRLGYELGLTDIILKRHPFPGPGLAIRLPGCVTEERVRILQQVDAIYLDEIRRAGLYDAIWQAFATLLPVQSVGVVGDNRVFGDTCVLRAVVSLDGMTASAFTFPPSFLGDVAAAITNKVPAVTRVLYDVTSKPPATIEWE